MKHFAFLFGLILLFALAVALPAEPNAERDEFYHLRALEKYVQSQQLDNTTISIEKRGLGDNPRLTLSMGGNKQHMGDYNEEVIFKFVHEALDEFCPVSQCDRRLAPEECCRNYNPRDQNYKYGTVYKDQNGNYATNAHIKLSLSHGKVRNNKELRDLMFMTVAETYKREIGANCYQETWKDKTKTTFCNIGEAVDLQVGEYRVHTYLKFNGVTASGSAKCENWKTGIKEGFGLYKDHYYQLNNGVSFATDLFCCDEQYKNCDII
ncbi:hypothetical protein BDV96DRAFT_642183 [Lophiotrema nucula]|uniref:Uncharacterized protein n=1 Tax=Lophiotrema nucula TaxID=690887 RepID=A0A6A5ZQ07_9PLEO|nr:hypothetical protein BDV96DRAFT_642183 [Lophiotrema nucula]